MNAAKITRRLVAAVEAFLGNTEATRKWPHVAAQAQQLHTAIDNEIVATMMEPDRSKAQGNEQLFTKSSRRKLLRRLGYWKGQTRGLKAKTKRELASRVGARITTMWNVRAGLGAPDASLRSIAKFCNEFAADSVKTISHEQVARLRDAFAEMVKAGKAM